MAESDYLREQAERCLRLAQTASEPGLARALIKVANEYLDKAEALKESDQRHGRFRGGV